jgi:hypothetical protein
MLDCLTLKKEAVYFSETSVFTNRQGVTSQTNYVSMSSALRNLNLETFALECNM